MTAKPSYEELERRVQELEKIESEYKHLMEVSQENESLFKRLYEKAPLGYQSLDENGHFVAVDPIWLDTLGYAKEEVIGKSITEFLHPDWREHFKENFPRFKSIGEVLEAEFEMVKKNGDLILVSFTGKISGDKKGNFQQTRCIFHDMTVRKNAEQDLRHSYQLMSYIIKHNTSALAVHDKDLNYLFVSERYLQDYKVKEKNIIGKHHYVVFPDLPQKWRDVHQKALAGITSSAENDRYDKEDGSVEWTTWECRPWYQANGEVGGFVVYTEVVTDKIKAEEQKLLLQKQLFQAQKMEAIGNLAGGIAHDFNNILGAIIGYAEMIQDDCQAGTTTARDIQQVLKAGNRAKELVKQILAFSRQTEIKKIPFQPAIIVTEAINLLRSSLPSTISIETDIDPQAGIILGDPSQIYQIIMNIFTNAFHAMEMKGGIISISLQKKVVLQDNSSKPKNFIQLSIRDTGVGISPEILGQIFDPYFTTKEIGKGTGMGLAMVHGIVQSYGGSIVCDSRLEEGTVFHISIPAIEGHALIEDESIRQISVGKEHILLIDDELILLDMGKTMLERLGYHVTAKNNSLEALAAFQNEPEVFDLVITDQTMPGMTGSDLSRCVLQIRADIPIILCTGYSSIIAEEKAKALGIKGFVMKPFSKKDISTVIRNILDAKSDLS